MDEASTGRGAGGPGQPRPGGVTFVEIVRILIVLLSIAGGYAIGGGSITSGVTTGHGSAPVLGALVGALAGYVAGGVLGRFLRAGIRKADLRLAQVAAPSLVAGAVGAVVGGGAAAIASVPVGVSMPYRMGWIVYFLAVWVGGYLGYSVAVSKSDELFAIAGLSTRPLARASSYSHNLGSEATIVDSSAILDGRLLSLAQAGLLSGSLLVPVFILDEIQAIADAQDTARRRRGRRGLDILDSLRTVPGVDVVVVEEEVVDHSTVDAKLVSLARRLRVGIITVDLTLQKAAELQDVRCLNLDQLTELLRANHLPGETLGIEISAEGKEPGQGVGYLDDGSMVVVTDAADRVGDHVSVRVANTVQTSLGTMIFATIDDLS